MKTIKILGILACLSLVALAPAVARDFSGIVHYNVKVAFDLPEDVSAEEAEKLAQISARIQTMVGSEVSLHFADSSFKFRSNGIYAEEIYQPYLGRMLQLKKDAGSYKEHLLNANLGPIERIEHLQETVQILGYKCQTLELEMEKSLATYYYAPSLEIDPQDFAPIKRDNWSVFAREALGVPLKFVLRDKTRGTYIVFTATRIESQRFDVGVFKPQTGKRIKYISTDSE